MAHVFRSLLIIPLLFTLFLCSSLATEADDRSVFCQKVCNAGKAMDLKVLNQLFTEETPQLIRDILISEYFEDPLAKGWKLVSVDYKPHFVPFPLVELPKQQLKSTGVLNLHYQMKGNEPHAMQLPAIQNANGEIRLVSNAEDKLVNDEKTIVDDSPLIKVKTLEEFKSKVATAIEAGDRKIFTELSYWWAVFPERKAIDCAIYNFEGKMPDTFRYRTPAGTQSSQPVIVIQQSSQEHNQTTAKVVFSDGAEGVITDFKLKDLKFKSVNLRPVSSLTDTEKTLMIRYLINGRFRNGTRYVPNAQVVALLNVEYETGSGRVYPVGITQDGCYVFTHEKIVTTD
ncbi:MAG: hypothetical protein LBH01_09555 [Verrucomicrobiales bacterium]|jgi:hypothetical protein|nr:hypothetical protein [Verrucomicrobiales bacterium]